MANANADFSDIMKALDQAPAKMMKAVLKCARKAGNSSARVMRSSIDTRFRKLVTAKAKKTQQGNISAAVGAYKGKGHVKEGSEVDDWFKWYWKEYGTLANRDPLHQFKQKRKARTREWQGGITPAHKFEAVKPEMKRVFQQSFDAEIRKEFEKVM